MTTESIQFHGVDIATLTADQLTKAFAHIRDEIGYHKNTMGEYPRKVHVYGFGAKGYLAMNESHHPVTHCTMCLTDSILE